MNKLAVLAFTLLVFFSTMLWYLASGSLNEYLKSQIQLQGQYYSQQVTQLAIADFSASSGIGAFKEATLANPKGYQAQYALLIDSATIELATPQSAAAVQSASPFKENHTFITTVQQLTINKLTLNSEHTSATQTSATQTSATQTSATQNNIAVLITLIKNQLAQGYPELYPAISAKLYAQKNPQLDAQAYAQTHPQAGPIIEHKEAKKKRGKPQAKINIHAITINSLVLNETHNGKTQTIQLNNLQLAPIGGEQGIATNQIGGELLLALLNLAPQNN